MTSWTIHQCICDRVTLASCALEDEQPALMIFKVDGIWVKFAGGTPDVSLQGLSKQSWRAEVIRVAESSRISSLT
jgi:hypothetical protein